MPRDLERLAAALPVDRVRVRPPDDSFSFVEHVWHLADLEREGFAERIRRLLSDESPALPDFDGARIARERDYRSLDVSRGLAVFAQARSENLSALLALSDADRARSGVQEGVGTITLAELPARMLDHDRSHRGELDALLRFIRQS